MNLHTNLDLTPAHITYIKKCSYHSKCALDKYKN